MSINIDGIVSALTSVRTNASLSVDERNAIVELAIARGIAYHLPLPTDGNITPTSYYNSQLSSVVKQNLSKVNEAFAFNVQRVYALVTELWTTRYNMVFMPYSADTDMLLEAIVRTRNELNPSYSMVFGHGAENPKTGEIAASLRRISHCFTGCLATEAQVGVV